MQITPYINFHGRCREAMEQKTFRAERFGMCVDRYGTGGLVNGGMTEEER